MENTKLVWNTTNGASAFSFHNGLTLTIEQSATAGGFSFVVMNTPCGTEMPDLVWEGIELCISDAMTAAEQIAGQSWWAAET